MAVQALTETSVKNLTDQQRITVEKLGEALTATHAGLHEQFQRMQMVQDERGGQIERFVNDRLAQALQAQNNRSQQQSPVNDDTDTNGDDVTTYDEYQLERRMQEAWRRNYLDESSCVSHGAASSTDQDQCSQTLLVSQSANSRTEHEPLREVEDEEEESEQREEGTFLLQESSTPEMGDIVLTQPTHVRENAQQHHHSPQHPPHKRCG
ncbi:hypothetical protein PHYPSEUDO_007617 [Phytophthora pseudosyringae]|uniref:Uncharacterized protein n=1 Tax=Phytophthora pseudosyringae TaxID=221518 RepID=A0A8T1VGP0_9STRA|nr:hypothetical protein PHYPSEUDO_007617 [Phytophthora pseudosyringae]